MDCSIPDFPIHHRLPELLKLVSIELVMPSRHLIFCRPLLLLPSIFPNIRVFANEMALRIKWPSTGVSASATLLPMNIQDWFLLRLTGLISLQSKGLLCLLQHWTPTQFKSINSSALSFLYGPTLTSIHDYWKNHSFDYTDLYRQSNICFLICCLGWS